MSVDVKYNGNNLISLEQGQKVKLPCAGKIMAGDIEINAPGISYVPINGSMRQYRVLGESIEAGDFVDFTMRYEKDFTIKTLDKIESSNDYSYFKFYVLKSGIILLIYVKKSSTTIYFETYNYIDRNYLTQGNAVLIDSTSYSIGTYSKLEVGFAANTNSIFVIRTNKNSNKEYALCYVGVTRFSDTGYFTTSFSQAFLAYGNYLYEMSFSTAIVRDSNLILRTVSMNNMGVFVDIKQYTLSIDVATGKIISQVTLIESNWDNHGTNYFSRFSLPFNVVNGGDVLIQYESTTQMRVHRLPRGDTWLQNLGSVISGNFSAKARCYNGFDIYRLYANSDGVCEIEQSDISGTLKIIRKWTIGNLLGKHATLCNMVVLQNNRLLINYVRVNDNGVAQERVYRLWDITNEPFELDVYSDKDNIDKTKDMRSIGDMAITITFDNDNPRIGADVVWIDNDKLYVGEGEKGIYVKKSKSLSVFGVAKTAGNTGDLIEVYQNITPAISDEIIEGNHIVFSSERPFRMGIVGNLRCDGIIEYSTTGKVWKEWTNSNTEIFADTTKLYLRGRGNTKINTQFSFSDVSTRYKIYCYGNIENLLDYEKVSRGEHPEMASNCYTNMFKDCTSLASAPELPATTLASSCYESMFKGCTSLVSAPELPATKLVTYCYYKMFEGCTSLIDLPIIPASYSVEYACARMFYGCKKIKLSEIQTEEYTTEYIIPFSTTSNSNTSMFTNTGGTFTGTPQSHMIYYTSNTVLYPN